MTTQTINNPVGQDLADENGNTTSRLIDVDVHEMLRSGHDLVPYLPTGFREHITERGWQMERRLPYTQMSVAGLDRADAAPPEGGPGGSSLAFMQEQLLDQYNMRHVILSGLYYPSTMHGWYEFATELARAYNDWIIEHWLAKDSRICSSIQVAAQNPIAAAREIERVGSHPQMVQVMLPLTDHLLYGDPQFDPIYEAAAHHNLVIGMHQSGATVTAQGYMRHFIEWHTGICQAWMAQLISVIANGVFERFPTLRMSMIEGGFTWVPHIMSRFDQQYRQLRSEVPWLRQFPSDYIRNHVRFATQPIEEMSGQRFQQLIEWMGSDRLLMFSSDYPHWDFDSPETSLPPIPETLSEKILHGNAEQWYAFPTHQPTLDRGTSVTAAAPH